MSVYPSCGNLLGRPGQMNVLFGNFCAKRIGKLGKDDTLTTKRKSTLNCVQYFTSMQLRAVLFEQLMYDTCDTASQMSYSDAAVADTIHFPC